MKFYTLFIVIIFAIFSSCTSCDSGAQVDTAAIEEPEQKDIETTYLREPVEIIASTGEDYPQSLIDLEFPVLPNAEVTSVGNTDIANGTVVMQMETKNSIAQIKAYYAEEMVKNGWTQKSMKIFQGADDAYSFRTEEHSARVMVINDKIQDFRKVAVTLNKRVDPNKLGTQN